MKNLLTILFVIMMTGFSAILKAQTMASLSASAGATIIVPMTMTEQNAINFGATTKQIGVGGKVILSTNNAALDYQGGVTGTASGISASNAVFYITGAADYGYTLTMPNTITIEGPDSMMMIIDDLKIRFNNGSQEVAINQGANSITNILNANGNDTFRLGGRLNINSDQLAGNYTGSYNVTVDYN